MSYDPKAGRFISQDPIEFKSGDADFYRYVGNNPTNFIDPSGLIDVRDFQKALTEPGYLTIDPSMTGDPSRFKPEEGSTLVPISILIPPKTPPSLEAPSPPFNSGEQPPGVGVPNYSTDADALFTPQGVLKIPDGTICTVWKDKDGTYHWTWVGLLPPKWYPIYGPPNPFGIPNPVAPPRG